MCGYKACVDWQKLEKCQEKHSTAECSKILQCFYQSQTDYNYTQHSKHILNSSYKIRIRKAVILDTNDDLESEHAWCVLL